MDTTQAEVVRLTPPTENEWDRELHLAALVWDSCEDGHLLDAFEPLLRRAAGFIAVTERLDPSPTAAEIRAAAFTAIVTAAEHVFVGVDPDEDGE